MLKPARKASSIAVLWVLLGVAPSVWAQEHASPGLSLGEAIRQALDYYPSISGAESQRIAQGEAILGAKGRHWPTVGLEGNTSWHRDSQYDQDNTHGVLVRVPVYSGGGIEANVRLREALYDKASADLTYTRNTVVLQAGSAYLGWYHALNALRLAQTNLTMINSIVSDIQEVALADPGRRSDVSQAVVRQAKAQQEVERQRAELVRAEANYQRFIGSPPFGEADLDDKWILQGVPTTREAGITRLGFDHPSILAADAEVRSAEANIEVAKANTRPSLALDVRSARGGSAVLNMNWTGFDLSTRYAVSSAKASLLSGQSTAQDVRLQVIEAFKQSWAALEGARARQQYAQIQVETGEKVLEAYKDQFQIGRRSLLDLLNAADEVYSNRLSALTTQSDLYFARYRVAASLGRLAEYY